MLQMLFTPWRCRAIAWLALSAGSLACEVAAQASVYRCSDESGKVSYQAQPCPDATASKRMEVGGRAASAPPSPARATKPRQVEPGAGYAGMPAVSWSSRVPDGGGERNAVPYVPDPQATSLPRPPSRVLAPVAPAAAPPQGAQKWGEGADVILVSAYQLASRSTQVHVNHPSRPVLLVLSSYERTEWRVLPAPGTQIKAVVVGSYQGRSTVQAPPQVPVAADDLPYAYETGSSEFRELIGKLHGRYGVNKILGFRGGYTLPEVVPVTGPFLPDPKLSLEGVRPEVPRVRMSFNLMSTDGRPLPWTNTGPGDGKRYAGVVRGGGGPGAWHGQVAVAADEAEVYVLSGNGGTLQWYPQGIGGPAQKLEVPSNLPELSWGSGMAWNGRKGILAIVSFGGEGYFYRYDARARQWLGARSLQNRDLVSLSHNAQTGGYVAVSNAGELVVFNERGELEEVYGLADKLPDMDLPRERGSRALGALTVVAQGKVVALVKVVNQSVTQIWTYELGSRKGQLTYKVVD